MRGRIVMLCHPSCVDVKRTAPSQGWFPYDRYDRQERCHRWKKKPSAIVVIMWKPPFRDRSDHSNHMKTSLYGKCSAIKVAPTAQLFW